MCRHLAITSWIHSELNYGNLGRLDNLTKLELWTASTKNLISVAELPSLRELKLRVKSEATLDAIGQTRNVLVTKLDFGLAEDPKKMVG